MQIVIVRHGTAESDKPDHERRLTADGRKEAKTLATFLRNVTSKPVGVLSSPLPRAMETAQEIAAVYSLNAVAEPVLESATPAKMIQLLQPRLPFESIVIVGHMPAMGKFVSFLCTGGSMEFEFSLPPCGCCAVEVATIPPVMAGKVLWFVRPSLLAHLS